MIYAFTESGDGDATSLMSCMANAITSGPTDGRCWRWRCRNIKMDGAREVANLIEGAAQKDEFEALADCAR
jgi:hypothetical protein